MVTNLSKEREEEFLKFEEKFKESSNDIVNKINEETENKLALMEREFDERKEIVIQELIKKVLMEINPTLHRNLRLD